MNVPWSTLQVYVNLIILTPHLLTLLKNKTVLRNKLYSWIKIY